MAQYDNTNRGVLFKNEDKQQDTHADYRGKINVGGTEYWLDAWIKEGKESGKKFMSLSVKPKQQTAPIDVSKSPGRLQNKPPTAKGDRFHGTDDDFNL